MCIVMTFDRRKVEIDSAWMQANATLFHYAQAIDGVWVPICDLRRYESGNRPFFNPGRFPGRVIEERHT